MKEVTFIIQCKTVNGELEMFQWLPGRIVRLDLNPGELANSISKGLQDMFEKMDKGQQIVVNVQLK